MRWAKPIAANSPVPGLKRLPSRVGNRGAGAGPQTAFHQECLGLTPEIGRKCSRENRAMRYGGAIPIRVMGCGFASNTTRAAAARVSWSPASEPRLGERSAPRSRCVARSRQPIAAVLARLAQLIARLGNVIGHRHYPSTRSAIVAKWLVADAICASMSSRWK